jgi:predicted amidophosphoribosyltransferase
VCTECWNAVFSFERAIALGELGHPLARAVVLHKDAGERRLGGHLGEMLATVVAAQWAGWPDAVTWVPPTSAALARRGFDHARGIAAPLAATLAVPLLPMLVRRAARDQRALGRSARALNAARTFSASGPVPRRVLIVDDVLTTGATLDAASSTLLEAGAGEVRVAVVARSW